MINKYPCYMIHPEQLKVIQVDKKFRVFMDPGGLSSR